MKPQKWDGGISLIRLTEPYEIEVSARGSEFHMIFGAHEYGNYLCIPNWSIGTEMASLSDRFWNYERLVQYTGLAEVDACSIADALVKLSKLI
jgi:hypothetical protein